MLLFFLTHPFTKALSQEQELKYKTVVAEGVSALVPGKQIDRAYDEALIDAKRNAIHIGLGLLVNSETIVNNYELISDKILSQSAGYVRHYDVISRGSDGDLYRVVISAEVALADLNSDLLAIQLLKQEKGYPRLMLIGVEKEGDEQKSSVTVQTAIEDELIKKGFDLVDESQVEIIKARDVALHPDDPQMAAALGQRYGAEIIIVFQAMADYEGASDAYGLNLNSYRCTVDARMIYTDTADLFASVSGSTYAAAEGKPAAIRLSFQKAGKKISPLIIEKILQNWQERKNKLELVVNGITYEEMILIKDRLQILRRVNAVGAPKFDQGVAVFHLQGDLAAEELAKKLMEQKDIPSLEITGLSSSRVETRKKTSEKPPIE